MHRNTVSGYETDYGNDEDLSYTFNNVNQMSAISDADDAGYSCSVTCDANNNITQIEEVQTVGANSAVLLTDFSYDWGMLAFSFRGQVPVTNQRNCQWPFPTKNPQTGTFALLVQSQAGSSRY